MKPNAKHDDISLSALARCAREAGVTVPEAALPGLAEYLQLLSCLSSELKADSFRAGLFRCTNASELFRELISQDR